jgi:hypothetical protein
MIELEINQRVLERLRQHFPKPANSAERALNKYVSLLAQQLNSCIETGRSKEQVERGVYFISLNKQRHKGGQIGKDKIRLQNWLEKNQLDLFSVIEIGSNLTEQLTQIKLTKLATVQKKDIPMIDHEKHTTNEIKRLRYELSLKNSELFATTYPDIESLEPEEIKQCYDFVLIDQRSLANYIRWLKNEATLIKEEEREKLELRSEKILRIAQHADGYFLQRKKPSSYGRVYYEGFSVQSVSKTMREAMLGHANEYDMKSAVFTWKMCYAKEAAKSAGQDQATEQLFRSTHLYLTDKNDFISYVRYMTFLKDSNVPLELQYKLIKQAMTAIGFGARLTATSWKINGEQQHTAIGEIFKNYYERQRFLSCDMIKDFIREQSLLDSYIFDAGKAQSAEYFGSADIRTQSGRLSKAKVLAFLYQTFETELMDLICELIEQKNKRVIARIHDAVITKQKLSVDDREEILYKIKQATENEYWKLNHKELKPFVYDSEDPLPAEQLKESTLISWFGKLVGA